MLYPDVICVNNAFYMVSTTMHFMPCCVILKSYNLDKAIQYQLNLLDSLDLYTRKHCENVATIVCPSENQLNHMFSYAFRKNAESIGKTINIQEDYLVKYPVDDIRHDIVDNSLSELNKWLLSLPASVALKKRKILDKALDKMDDEHNGIFAYHFIKDVDIRKHISNTMKLSSNAKNIEGENIIVIDDTMSQGKTLAEACQLLCGSYLPKTIVGLTLFSPLKSK